MMSQILSKLQVGGSNIILLSLASNIIDCSETLQTEAPILMTRILLYPYSGIEKFDSDGVLMLITSLLFCETVLTLEVAREYKNVKK